jgi:uncharacterized membrane protein
MGKAAAQSAYDVPQPYEVMPGADAKSLTPKIVYCLYAAGFIFFVPALIGFLIAWMHTEDRDELVSSHAQYQLRVVAIGAAMLMVGAVMIPVYIGWAIIALWVVGTIGAIIKGLDAYNKGETMK